MKKKDIINVILLIILLTAGYLLHKSRTYTVNGSQFLLDTIIEITFTSRNPDSNELLDRCFALVDSLDREYSYYREGSVLQGINLSESDTVAISSDMHDMLQIGRDLYLQSDSLYDLSVGTLTDIWDFESARVPLAEEIAQALTFVGYDKIQIRQDSLVRPAGFKLNLGSLAKGYIIDRLCYYLEEQDVLSAIINAGGDIRLFGQKKPLRIGIQHPREEKNEVLKVIRIKEAAIATSGDYERSFFLDGVRYHHLLNPLTGYPARNNVSVTVIASTAVIADAYSTALFLMPSGEAIALADSIPGLEAIIFYESASGLSSVQSAGFTDFLE